MAISQANFTLTSVPRRLMAKNITSSPTTYTGNIYELLLYTKTKTRTAKRGAAHLHACILLLRARGLKLDVRAVPFRFSHCP